MTILTEDINYKELHKERKYKVLELLDKARQHFVTFSNEERVKAFESLYSNIENGEFSIVVVGEFSAGKSTFLNALMHDKFLPSFSNETTATINFLKHKDRSENGREVAIHYKDPAKESDYTEATIENIKQYVSTESDINVADDIDRVELFLDSKFLSDGVMLVDSPGLNGIAEGHKEITEHQIEKSHACIFMFSAEQPGRKSDFEFLTNLMSKVDTVLLVLNKIDVIKSTEQTVDDVVMILKENYRNVFPDKPMPEIWPIAAYPALVARSQQSLDYQGKTTHSDDGKKTYLEKSRIEGFETRLWRFLTQGERAKQELLAPVDRVKKIMLGRKQELVARKEELEQVSDSNDIKLEIKKLEDEITGIEESLLEKKQDISQEVNLMIKEMRENLKSKTQDLKMKYNHSVGEWTDLNNLSSDLEQFNKKIVTNYQSVMGDVYKEFLEEFEEMIKNRYKEYAQDFEQALLDAGETKELKVEVNHRVDIDSFDMNFGLEDYRSKIEQYEKDITELEHKADKALEERIVAERNQLEKENLVEKLEMVKRREESFMSILGPRPSVRKLAETEHVQASRGGLFGWAADGLFGKKLKPVQTYTTDNSDQKNYDEQMKLIEGKMEREKKELSEQLNSIKDPDKRPEQYELIQNKLQRSEREKRDALQQLHEEYKEQFQKKHSSVLRKVRNELEDFIDQLQKDVENEFYKKIRQQRSEVTEIVIDIISKHVKEKKASKIEELEIRKTQLESSQEEKSKFINEYNQEIEEIQKLLVELLPIQLELESTNVDVIEVS